ncbi:uncharacterized protein HD556DRAFT_316957 [Suillus plorans]|uniref:Uncharacterized protein n=1 Tax=Suillus plorans TaxID=116603 RepID=A0A9P7J7A7_9AGAM|nr:uncharacterized protein HD556DRAFT_316957 [Suillus plorans]KAG1806495.1 hypothetical protein HD556DRAFT_316957 [Suillus plorans]
MPYRTPKLTQRKIKPARMLPQFSIILTPFLIPVLALHPKGQLNILPHASMLCPLYGPYGSSELQHCHGITPKLIHVIIFAWAMLAMLYCCTGGV